MSRRPPQIEFSSRVKCVLEKELNGRQLAGHYRIRMQIVYQSAQGKMNEQVGQQIGCHPKTVSKWLKRWEKKQALLKAYEQGLEGAQITDRELLHKVKEILSDSYRKGAPARISETDINRLIALACESPQAHGLPFSHWTHEELRKQAKKMGIILSSVHLGRLLKKRARSA